LQERCGKKPNLPVLRVFQADVEVPFQLPVLQRQKGRLPRFAHGGYQGYFAEPVEVFRPDDEF
jgi:hypothetical protein